MKRIKPFLAAACLLMAVRATTATPLVRSDVPANPSWYAHVDCDSLRTTSIGQYLLNQLDQPEVKDKLAVLQGIFDIRTQLHGLTLYNVGQKPYDNIFIAYATFDPDRFLAMAKAAEAYAVLTNGSHVIYSWTNEGKGDNNPQHIYACIDGHRVILSQREDRVREALEVIDGHAPSLTTRSAMPKTGDSFLVIAARSAAIQGSNPTTALFKMAQEIEFQAGEENHQIKATLTLQTADVETARQMSGMVQGLLALAALQKNPDLTQLTQALNLSQEGSAVTATLALPAADLLAMFKAAAAKNAPPASPAQ